MAGSLTVSLPGTPGAPTTAPASGTAPVTPPTKPEGEATEPKYVTRADFESWGTELVKKLGGEIASLRKKNRGNGNSPPARQHAPAPGERDADPGTSPSAGVTIEDLKASRELGKLEEQAGRVLSKDDLEELQEECEELSLAEQARLYRAALRGRESGGTPTKEARGETPRATPRGRGADAPASRSTVVIPSSWEEWKKLPIEAKRKVQDEHPDWNPDELRPHRSRK